jgi:hypothetical protein
LSQLCRGSRVSNVQRQTRRSHRVHKRGLTVGITQTNTLEIRENGGDDSGITQYAERYEIQRQAAQSRPDGGMNIANQRPRTQQPAIRPRRESGYQQVVFPDNQESLRVTHTPIHPKALEMATV